MRIMDSSLLHMTIQDAHLAVAANRLIHALGFNTQQQSESAR